MSKTLDKSLLQPRWKPGSRTELIGRPLVPFFDTGETLEQGEQEEEIHINAREWKDGYFVDSGEKNTIRKHRSSSGMRQQPAAEERARKSRTPPPNFFSTVVTVGGEEKVLKAPSSLQAFILSIEQEKQATPPPQQSCDPRIQSFTPPPSFSPESAKTPEHLKHSKFAWSSFQQSPDPASLPMPSVGITGRKPEPVVVVPDKIAAVFPKTKRGGRGPKGGGKARTKKKGKAPPMLVPPKILARPKGSNDTELLKSLLKL